MAVQANTQSLVNYTVRTGLDAEAWPEGVEAKSPDHAIELAVASFRASVRGGDYNDCDTCEAPAGDVYLSVESEDCELPLSVVVDLDA